MLMKKFFYLCMIALGCMVGFTACGDDDDDLNYDDLENLTPTDVKADLKDNGNSLVITYVVSAGNIKASVQGTYKFDGSSDNANFVSGQLVYTYPNETIARQAYESDYDEWEKSEGLVRLSGKQIIEDDSEEYEGMTKAEVKEYLQMMVNYIKNHGTD